MKVYQHIAAELQRAQSKDATHSQWARNCIRHLEENYLPSGSGFDNGCEVLTEYSPNGFLLSCEFHHLSEHGYYTHWSHNEAEITAHIVHGFEINVSGEDLEMSDKEYITDTLIEHLEREISKTEWNKIILDCKP